MGRSSYAVHSRRNLLRDCRRSRRRGIAVAGSQGALTMIAGHFGFAAGVKAAEPQIPLWSLMLATAWLDVVFIPLLLGGVETIASVPGAGGYGNSIIHADYTHSLLGALVLSALYGALFLPRWGRRAAYV